MFRLIRKTLRTQFTSDSFERKFARRGIALIDLQKSAQGEKVCGGRTFLEKFYLQPTGKL